MTRFGDCRQSMREMIAEGVRVQMCVTSPPYFGLRDYGHSGQIGLEASPLEYVATMVDVFRLVRDLLVDDGTLWLNLGDSYVSVGAGTQGENGEMATRRVAQVRDQKAIHSTIQRPPSVHGLSPKNLMGIPWRVAFALQADGWYLRQDIIWSKPNPMPEAVTDRCTKAHEYVFLLAKRARYYYDTEAVAESSLRQQSWNKHRKKRGDHGGVKEHSAAHQSFGVPWEGSRRNRRSVWTVATKPFSGAHFATFPPDLIEPCILAGSRPGDTVLDPFIGSGTVGEVCNNLGRRWIGCELNEAYRSLIDERTAQQGMVFACA